MFLVLGHAKLPFLAWSGHGRADVLSVRLASDCQNWLHSMAGSSLLAGVSHGRHEIKLIDKTFPNEMKLMCSASHGPGFEIYNILQRHMCQCWCLKSKAWLTIVQIQHMSDMNEYHMKKVGYLLFVPYYLSRFAQK